MKVLLFTHKSDIDGIGSLVLAKEAFGEINYVLCEAFNLQDAVKKYYESQEIYQYDKIFITDLFLENPLLTTIAEDELLNKKLFVFDHHESELKNNLNNYPFVTLKIKDKKGLCSGTSLFYEYLISNQFIEEQKQIIDDFVELTRQYDTWEWTTKYKNEVPHELCLLFQVLGPEGYAELIFQKLNKSSKSDSFSFDKLETILINNKKNKIQEKLNYYKEKLYYKTVMGYKAGILFIDYQDRNDIKDYLIDQKIDIDFVMLVSLEHETISYRSMKPGFNVRVIAEYFGGKGHDEAAGSVISKKNQDSIINFLIGQKSDMERKV